MPSIKKGPLTHHVDRRALQLMDQGSGGNSEDLLSTRQAADWFGNSRQWWELGRSKGYGPPFVRLGPRSIRYRRRDVLEWLQSRVHARTADYQTLQKPRATARRAEYPASSHQPTRSQKSGK